MKILFTTMAVALGSHQLLLRKSIPHTSEKRHGPPSSLYRPFTPTVANNPITPEKIALGKAMFFDPRVSASGVFSCNSCHNLATGGDDNHESFDRPWLAEGTAQRADGTERCLQHTQFWDGRAEDLKAQAKAPIQAAVEMANTPGQLIATLKSMPQYVEWFNSAFPGEADRVTFENVAKAIEAFEATLVTPAPFDAFLNGDDAAMIPNRNRA